MKETIANIDSPFTELFSLLKSSEIQSEKCLMGQYGADELSAINHHVDNAMTILLQGTQELGNLMSLAAKNKEQVINEMESIGFFISAIGNLAEALYVLRQDTDYILKQRVKKLSTA